MASALRWKFEMDKWIKDESKNIFEIKLEGQKGRNLDFSILGLIKFSVEVNDNVNVTKVTSNEEDLQGEWLTKMNEFAANNPKASLAEFLEKASQVYNEKDPDIAPTPTVDSKTPSFSQEDYFDDETDTPFASSVDFELPLEPPSAQVMKEKQKQVIRDHLAQKVQTTINNLEVADTIKQMQSVALKDYSKKADKVMYVRFFTDRTFTIDDGHPRSMDDPKEKQLLDAFGKGFVPPEYSKNAREVDLHVIWEDYKYPEWVQAQKAKEQAQAMAKLNDDEIEAQILEQIQQESLMAHLERERASQPKVPAPINKPAEKKPEEKTSSSSGGFVLGKPTTTTTPATVTTTTTTTTTTTVKTTSTTTPQVVQQQPKPVFNYTCDTSKPHTSIQFRFDDGSKIVQQFNLTDTVETLYKFIAASDKAPSKPFRLIQSFPRQDLVNKNVDIQTQKLENGTLLVKAE